MTTIFNGNLDGSAINDIYRGILRSPPPTDPNDPLFPFNFMNWSSSPATAGVLAEDFLAKLFNLETALLNAAQNSTIPALTVYDLFFGATPWSGGLDNLTSYSRGLEAQGFSPQNVYVNLGASFITTSPMANTYARESRTAFLGDVYKQIFGHAPTQDTVNYLLSTFDFYQNVTGSDLGAKGALAGVLMWAANTGTAPSIGSFSMYANQFLHAAAIGDAPYGQELHSFNGYGPTMIADDAQNNAVEGSTIDFSVRTAAPPGTVLFYTIDGLGTTQVAAPLRGGVTVNRYGWAELSVPTWPTVFDGSQPTITLTIDSASTDTVTINNFDSSVTPVTGGPVIDPGAGTGDHVIQFIGGGGNTLVLHAGSVDYVNGFTRNAVVPDALDFSALFANANISTDMALANFNNFVFGFMNGSDLDVMFDPAGTQNFSATNDVAVLRAFPFGLLGGLVQGQHVDVPLGAPI